MKVMLTSFGIEHSILSADRHKSIFHNMPPVSFRWMNEMFMPDYELLLLCDSVIMDGASLDRLIHGSVPAYSHVADVFQSLRSEGRIEIKDFSSVLKSQSNLLQRMIEHDIKLLDHWVNPLRESLSLWQHFSMMTMDIMRSEREPGPHQAPLRNIEYYQRYQLVLLHEIGHMAIHKANNNMQLISTMVAEALESSEKRKRKEYRGPLRDVLRTYLAYVDANLILSHELGVGFHDWLDFTPFYAAKFLSVGQNGNPVEKGRAQLEKLFTVPFPDLAIRNTRSLMKALNDKRINELRQLVDQAAHGKVEFDNEFAKRVLIEVFEDSKRAKKWRNVLGYATLPIGFIPWVGTVAQKAIEEGVGIPLENKLKEKHRWFYMLSEIAESEGKNSDNRMENGR